MEIVIGAVNRVGQPGQKAEARGGFVEAQVLNIRPPRRRRGGPRNGKPDRRDKGNTHDPVSGRVMVLLVSDGYHIPQDLSSGNYRVFLRFAPKRK
jgi:hypothetical protein